MEKNTNDKERQRKRFSKAKHGDVIWRLYRTMTTAELARRMGLTVKQIENYVYKFNDEPWAHKDPALMSAMNREKGKKGGRPKKNVGN